MTMKDFPCNANAELRQRVRDLVVAHGLPRLARMLGVHRQTILVMISGAPVPTATVLLVRERLESLVKSGEP